MADNKGSTRNFIIIILVIILFVNIGSFIIGAKIIIPMFYGENESLETSPSGETAQDTSTGQSLPVVRKNLEPINLNPAGSSGEIFSCDIVLEAENQLVEAELTRRDYEIQDKLSTYLSFKTVSELNDPQNWETYKKDMLKIINSVLKDGKVTSINIPQKIIQFP